MSRRKMYMSQTIMLRQTKIVIHRQLVGVGKNRKLEDVEVPVYRGQSAKFMRHERSQLKRKRRILAEEQAKEASGPVAVSIPDDLIEELTHDRDNDTNHQEAEGRVDEGAAER